MGVQQHEFDKQREARLRLLDSIDSGDTTFEMLEDIDLSCRLLGPDHLSTLLDRFDVRPQLALKHLTLGFNDIGVAGAKRLTRSALCAHVESLDLAGNELGDDGVQALCAGAVFSNLNTLKLSYNEISDEGARALANAKVFPKLQHLNLRRNRIGNEGIRALCAHDFPDRLTRLNVEYNEFQREGFDLLDDAFDEAKTSIW